MKFADSINEPSNLPVELSISITNTEDAQNECRTNESSAFFGMSLIFSIFL